MIKEAQKNNPEISSGPLKKTLLHHKLTNILDSDSKLKDMAHEFVEFRIVSRTNFEEVITNLDT